MRPYKSLPENSMLPESLCSKTGQVWLSLFAVDGMKGMRLRKDQLHGAAPKPFQGAGQLGQRGCPAQAHGLAIFSLLAAISVGVILVLFSLCILLIADILIICRCKTPHDCSSL